jgi:hypothetical protein
MLKSRPSFLKLLHHMIFGFGMLFLAMPGHHNHIIVLQRSPFFARLTEGKAPPCYYTVNGHECNMGYYLVDDIYPPWATFDNTISNIVGQKKSHFSQRQEAARKDAESAFGFLQTRFVVVRGTTKQWYVETLWEVMTYCVIMHNMIVENEGDDAAASLEFENMGDPIELPNQNPATFEEFAQMYQQIRQRWMAAPLSAD